MRGDGTRSGLIVGFLCFVGALALYWATAKPDLVGGDPGEFQFVPAVLGIPHHTGYPLYTMVGWAWSQLPLGSIAWRMNLFSGIWGAAAVGFAAALGTRLARGTPLPWLSGLVGAVALAVAPLPWHWSTIAGVRSGAVAEIGWVLLAAVGLLVALECGGRKAGRSENGAAGDKPLPYGPIGESEVAERPSPRPSPRGRGGTAFAVLGLAAGIALAHHRSGALALPGVALAVASMPAAWRLGARAWAAAIGLGLLPLLTYLYLPLRARQGPPFQQWHPETWDGFWDLALAVEHSRVHFAFPLSAMPARAELLYAHLRGEVGWLGLAMAALGALWLLVRWPRAFVVLAGYFAAQSWQVLNWDVGRDQLNVVYQLPAHLVVAVWLGLGVAAIAWAANMVTRPWGTRFGAAAAALAGAVLIAWAGARGARELATQRARATAPINHDRSVLADGYGARRIVGGGLARVEPNAIVVGDWEQATVAWYLQLVEGVASKVEVNYPVTNLPFTLKDHPDRPVWLMARTAVPEGYRLSNDGPFVRVSPSGQVATAPPADAAPASVRFEDALEVVGVAYADRAGRRIPQPDTGGDVLPITLYWQALGGSRPDLSVSLRLIDSGGAIAAQRDNTSPVLSLYPTSRWREGEVVGDYYELPYRVLPPGTYRLELRVYSVANGSFRDYVVGGADYATIGSVVR